MQNEKSLKLTFNISLKVFQKINAEYRGVDFATTRRKQLQPRGGCKLLCI